MITFFKSWIYSWTAISSSHSRNIRKSIANFSPYSILSNKIRSTLFINSPINLSTIILLSISTFLPLFTRYPSKKPIYASSIHNKINILLKKECLVYKTVGEQAGNILQNRQTKIEMLKWYKMINLWLIERLILKLWNISFNLNDFKVSKLYWMKMFAGQTYIKSSYKICKERKMKVNYLRENMFRYISYRKFGLLIMKKRYKYLNNAIILPKIVSLK
jgi:hypothetical protein